MFGYMGFGLVKWIYRQRPKEFNSMEGKPIHSEIEAYKPQKFEFNYPGKITLPALLELSRIRTANHKSLRIMGIFIFLGILFFVSLLIRDVITKMNNNWAATSALNQKRINEEKAYAYNFLLESSIYATSTNNYQAAYYEFTLAEKQKPGEIYHYVLLANMYVELCQNKGIYCNETAFFMEQLKRVYKDDPYLKHLSFF